jgi:hypothetical protein
MNSDLIYWAADCRRGDLNPQGVRYAERAQGVRVYQLPPLRPSRVLTGASNGGTHSIRYQPRLLMLAVWATMEMCPSTTLWWSYRFPPILGDSKPGTRQRLRLLRLCSYITASPTRLGAGATSRSRTNSARSDGRYLTARFERRTYFGPRCRNLHPAKVWSSTHRMRAAAEGFRSSSCILAIVSKKQKTRPGVASAEPGSNVSIPLCDSLNSIPCTSMKSTSNEKI